MFCKNCGAQLPDGSISCDACGTILAEKNEAAQVDNTEYLSYSEMSSQSSVNALNGTAADKPKKDKNNNFLIIALVSVILLVAIVITAVILFVNGDRGSNGGGITDGAQTTTTTTASVVSEDGEITLNGVSFTDPMTETTPVTDETANSEADSSTKPTSQETTEKTSEKTTSTTKAPSRPSLADAEKAAEGYVTDIYTNVPDWMKETYSDVVPDSTSAIGSYYVSATDAASYVNKTVSEYGSLLNNSVDWSNSKDYAAVKLENTYKGSDHEKSYNNVLCGYINGKWQFLCFI